MVLLGSLSVGSWRGVKGLEGAPRFHILEQVVFFAHDGPRLEDVRLILQGADDLLLGCGCSCSLILAIRFLCPVVAKDWSYVLIRGERYLLLLRYRFFLRPLKHQMLLRQVVLSL